VQVLAAGREVAGIRARRRARIATEERREAGDPGITGVRERRRLEIGEHDEPAPQERLPRRLSDAEALSGERAEHLAQLIVGDLVAVQIERRRARHRVARRDSQLADDILEVLALDLEVVTAAVQAARRAERDQREVDRPHAPMMRPTRAARGAPTAARRSTRSPESATTWPPSHGSPAPSTETARGAAADLARAAPDPEVA